MCSLRVGFPPRARMLLLEGVAGGRGPRGNDVGQRPAGPRRQCEDWQETKPSKIDVALHLAHGQRRGDSGRVCVWEWVHWVGPGGASSPSTGGADGPKPRQHPVHEKPRRRRQSDQCGVCRGRHPGLSRRLWLCPWVFSSCLWCSVGTFRLCLFVVLLRLLAVPINI